MRRVYRRADLVLDAEAHEVRIRGKRVALTRQQIEILRALFEADGATLRRDQLLERIGSLEWDISGRSVDLHVSRLRRRLGEDPDMPRYIEAVYGVGYRLAPERNDPSDGRFAAAILAALPEAVLILDERVIVRDVNPAAEVLLGRGREDLIGMACSEVVGCRGCDGMSLAGAACLARAALRGEARPDEVRGSVQGADRRVPVVFAHVEVVPDADVRLVALALRQDPERDPLTLAACNGAGSPTPATAAPASGPARKVALEATNDTYSIQALDAKVGEKIELEIKNTGDEKHNLVGVGTGISLASPDIDGDATVSWTWTAPLSAGQFKLVCAYHPNILPILVTVK